MDTNQSTLDPNSIIRAFQAVANPNNPKQLIKNADQYLSQCESDPTFSLIMLSLLSQCQYPQTQLQILIHLKTVIKRNWTTKRKIGNGCIISQPIKDQIKQKLVILYRIFWKSLYKEFNEIFKFLARQDFPANYLQLNGFIKEVLENVAGYQLDQVLGAQQLLPYLSLVKVVYKQYGQRRMLHSAQFFNIYCTPTLQKIKIILGKINEAFEVVRAKGQNMDAGIGNKLLECSRKVDKIALYCIQSMVSSLQYNPQILQIISYQIQKIPNLLSLNTPSLQPQIELNILAILQQTSKLQSFFPTSFTEFLHDYLQLITQLLFHSSFSNEKLQKVIIFANKIPFTCFLYYLNKTQFKQSLEYKKDNKVLHEKAQEKCYEVFMGFYAGNRCRVMLEKIVLEVMAKFKRDNQDDQILFQDAEVQGDGVGELGVYEMIVDLVQTIMNRFKVEAHQFVQQIINHLLNVRNEQINERIVQNMYELILLFPKALQRMRVNISQIIKLMENCYTNKNYDMFCRLVRNYHEYFQDQVLISSFQILVQIISNAQSKAHTVYQSSICIRKLILQHNELQLPLQKISPCISRIFRLIQEYKHTPTHLWNLLNVLIQILKALSLQTILINLQYMTRCIQILTQLPGNNNVIVCALVQLLQNLLVVVQGQIGSFLPQKVYLVRVALKVILADNVDNQEEEITQMSKHQLWLCVIKNLHESYCPEDLKKLLPQLIITLKQGITTSDPSLYLQILQQYLLSNLIKLSSTDLLTLYHQLVDQIQPDNDIRTLMSFFSLSFTFLLINCSANGFQLDQNTAKILLVCISKVKDMHMRISPSINGLRTLIMLQICYMILIVGGDVVFGAFNHVYQNYQQWFWPFITGLELINNKYASKVISIALFQSLNILKDTLKVHIDQNLPFDYVIKLITVHTDPIPVQQSMNTYENSLKLFSHIEEIKSKARFSFGNKHSRKIKTHVNQTLSEYDLRAAYRQQISQLYRVWDWGVDDLQERYSDKMVEKMVKLLDFQNGN